MNLLKASEVYSKIKTYSIYGPRKMYNGYVLLNRPGKRPEIRRSRDTMHITQESSLEVLMMNIRNQIAAKDKKAMRSTREKSKSTLR